MKVLLKDFGSLYSNETQNVTVDLENDILKLRHNNVTLFIIRKGIGDEGDVVIRFWSKEDGTSFEPRQP